MKAYDAWKLDSGQENEVFTCDYCDGPIGKGEEYIETINEDKLHCDCFSEFALSYLIKYVGIAGED